MNAKKSRNTRKGNKSWLPYAFLLVVLIIGTLVVNDQMQRRQALNEAMAQLTSSACK